jgi:hypothetical protein
LFRYDTIDKKRGRNSMDCTKFEDIDKELALGDSPFFRTLKTSEKSVHPYYDKSVVGARVWRWWIEQNPCPQAPGVHPPFQRSGGEEGTGTVRDQ